MSIEITLLAVVLVLALVQILWAAQARTSELGLKWNAGPRDGETPPPGPLAGRLMRAQSNLFETLPLFIGAVLAAHITDATGELTALGAQLYVFGRIVYLPLYVFGVPYLRSAVWAVSVVGLIMILAALFI